MVIFDNTTLYPSLHRQCVSQALEYFFYVGKIKMQWSMVVIPVKWNKPLPGWYKLNIDGASLGNLGRVRGGGLIRDSSRNWVESFSRSIARETSMIAKFWALRDGLILASQLDIQYLEIELDAKVVDLINSSNPSNAAYSSLLVDCKLLLNMLPRARVKHVFWEANLCADALAKNGCTLDVEFCVFDVLPSFVTALVYFDVNGVNYCRLTAANLAILAW